MLAASRPPSIRSVRCSTCPARRSWCPSTGYEVGIRNRSIAGWKTSLRCSGSISRPRTCSRATPTAPPSRAGRHGGSYRVEQTITRHALAALEGDLTITNARFADRDPSARVPEGADHDRVGGHHLGEGQGWSAPSASLFRAAPSDRGQLGALEADRASQRPGRVQLRQRGQPLPRRADLTNPRRIRSPTTTCHPAGKTRPASPIATSTSTGRADSRALTLAGRF